MLEGLKNIQDNLDQLVRDKVLNALEMDKSVTAGFKLPIVDRRLHYITVTNLCPYIPTDPQLW